MGWRRDEVWFDIDVLWFREQPREPFGVGAIALPALPSFSSPAETGLAASRSRRLAAESARKRRLATRTAPAVALVVGSASMLSYSALRPASAARSGLQEDPPSLSFRFGFKGIEISETPVPPWHPAPVVPARRPQTFPAVEWHHATSVGLPFGGHLVAGTQFPIAGVDWVTWNPATDSVPNAPHRLYGNERTVRALLSVIGAYRAAHPEAPRVVVGDLSFRDGGRMDQHVSHQNGLDVDVYYPRHDRHLSAPIATSQIDHALAQDLLDRFVAAGAQVVFVGFGTGLRGPSGVVVPYPNHENHMHVRFPHSGG